MTKPRFEASPDVEACADFLRENKDRDLISYAALAEATGREDIAGKSRHILASARRILEREGILFVVETGVGLKRASDAQVATLATSEPIIKTRRIAKKAKKRQSAVNVQNLTGEQRMAFWIGSAILGAIDQAASRAFKNRVTAAADKADGAIPMKQTLDLFRKMRPTRKSLQ